MMHNATLDKLIWVLIYAGMLVFGLGVWFVEHHLALGSTLIGFGGLAAGAGAVLIWVRSRRP